MRLARKLALGFVTMSLVALIVPVRDVSAESCRRHPPSASTRCCRSVEPGYYTPGDTITYRYEVTGNDRFINVAVTDDKCAAVTPVLGGGPGGAFNIGDTTEPFGALNGLAGEKWLYTCAMALPGGITPNATFVNKGRVTAIVPTPGWDAWQGTTFSDEDTYGLSGVILRKLVVLYWDYSHFVDYPAGANVEFEIDVFNGLDEERDGDRHGQQPTGAVARRRHVEPAGEDPRGAVHDGAGAAGPGTTSPPGPGGTTRSSTTSDFDLSIEKSGPSWAMGGASVTYNYAVKNDGPAAVKPVVTDDKCSPVTYTGGDTNADGKIQSTETWTFTCTYTPNWASAFPGYLKNTGRVVADEYPRPGRRLYGGDNDPANDTDYVKLYPFVLRKDVGLYTGGTPNWAFADTKAFTVKTYKGADYKTTFTIAEGSPKYLWLSSGTWKFTEVNLPKGYVAFYDKATITFTTGTYPDWTHLNVTWSACSHGFWKTHTPWPGGILPTHLVGTYFPESDYYDAATLQAALEFGGGSGVDGAERILLRQAVASLLNETEYGTAFGPYASVAALKTAVNNALATGDRTTMLHLASTLEWWNNGVCR